LRQLSADLKPRTGIHIGIRIAIIYAVFAAVWILLSDQLLELLVADAATLSRMQTYKGWFFVTTTAVLLYFLVHHYTVAIIRRDATLNEVVLGVSRKVGSEFFASLTEHLARALGARYAFIGELDSLGQRVRVLNIFASGEPGEPFSYELADTPCADVTSGRFCVYPSGVRKLFPEDQLLQTMEVESYIGTPLRSASGQPFGILVVMDDKPLEDLEQAESLLTIFAVRAVNELERMQSDTALQKQFNQISTIFDSLNAIVYVARLETYELLYLNSYGVQLFGENWRGRPCYEVLQSSQDRPCDFCTNDQLVRDGKLQGPCIWEFQNTVTGRWFQCIDKAIRWPGGEIVRLEIAVDISDRKEVELLKEQLISAVSHEMRTPLTIILGYTEYLRDHQAPEEEVGASLETIYHAAERLNGLVDTFLQLQRLLEQREALQMLPVSVSALFDLVARLFWYAHLSHPIRILVPPELPLVLGDAERLGRVMENLVSNAIKYSPQGGAVTLAAEQQGEELILSVNDCGIGLDAEQRQRVFERFYRVDNSDRRLAGGTGLGLTLAREIVELHGGRIWADCEPGGGCTFRFALPIAVKVAAAAN
jgi:two-component system, OmpR family, phosphate regulon sensor histidine kinase PhoR